MCTTGTRIKYTNKFISNQQFIEQNKPSINNLLYTNFKQK